MLLNILNFINKIKKIAGTKTKTITPKANEKQSIPIPDNLKFSFKNADLYSQEQHVKIKRRRRQRDIERQSRYEHFAQAKA